MKVKKVMHGLFLHGLGLILDDRVLLKHAAKEKVQTNQERKRLRKEKVSAQQSSSYEYEEL